MAIFGVPLYKRGIQPVWLEIVNNSPQRVRFAPTGLDPDLFCAAGSRLHASQGLQQGSHECANGQAILHGSALPRQIPAGESRAGYVFTHASPGTKSFNIDLVQRQASATVLRFLSPCRASLRTMLKLTSRRCTQPADLRVDLDQDGLRRASVGTRRWRTQRPARGSRPGCRSVSLSSVTWKSMSSRHCCGPAGSSLPASGTEEQLAKAHYLLRAGSGCRVPDPAQPVRNGSAMNCICGCRPCGWMVKPVWLAHIAHFIGQRTQLEQAIFGTRIDPDIDDGRNYFHARHVWYSQSLEQWPRGWPLGRATPVEDAGVDFQRFGVSLRMGS